MECRFLHFIIRREPCWIFLVIDRIRWFLPQTRFWEIGRFPNKNNCKTCSRYTELNFGWINQEVIFNHVLSDCKYFSTARCNAMLALNLATLSSQDRRSRLGIRGDLAHYGKPVSSQRQPFGRLFAFWWFAFVCSFVCFRGNNAQVFF